MDFLLGLIIVWLAISLIGGAFEAASMGGCGCLIVLIIVLALIFA